MSAFFGRMGAVVYNIIRVLQKPSMIHIFMALPSLMTIIGIMAAKSGKKKLTAIGCGAGLALIILHALYGFFCFSFPDVDDT